MSNHLHFNDQLPHGRLLRRALNLSEEGDDCLADARDLMVQMLDGDGSADAHYETIRGRFGFATQAEARAAFGEVDSAFSKTSGNASVTGSVAARAARDQLFSRLRG